MNNFELESEASIDEERAVRAFSKKQFPEERKNLAQEIKQKRKHYFLNKDNLSEKITSLKQEIGEKNIPLEEIESKIQSLYEKNNFSRNSLIRKLLDFLSRKSLEDSLTELKDRETDLKRGISEAQESMIAFQQQISDQHELDETKEMLSDFYTTQRLEYLDFENNQESEQFEQYEKYIKTEKGRDLAKVMQDNQVTFVHGVMKNIPVENSFLNQNADWQTRMDLAFSLSPTIACSTIKENQNFRHLWSSVGLILNRGRIDAAHSADVGSISMGLNKRITGLPDQEEDIGENIQSAINLNPKYNEIIVSKPSAIGIYICKDESVEKFAPDKISDPEIAQYADQRNIPVFVLVNGALHYAKFTDKNVFKPGQKLTLEELESIGAITDEKKQEMFEKVLSNQPFRPERIKLDELDQFICLNYGRSMYLKLCWPNITLPDNSTEEQIEVRSFGGSHLVSALPLSKINSYTLTEKFYIVKDQLMICRDNGTDNGTYFYSKDSQYFSIDMANGSWVSQIDKIENYLPALEKQIQKMQNDLNSEDPYFVEQSPKKIAQLTYHLRGVVEEATKWGDYKFAQECFELLKKIIPISSQDEVLKKRVDESGNFIFTKEDL